MSLASESYEGLWRSCDMHVLDWKKYFYPVTFTQLKESFIVLQSSMDLDVAFLRQTTPAIMHVEFDKGSLKLGSNTHFTLWAILWLPMIQSYCCNRPFERNQNADEI